MELLRKNKYVLIVGIHEARHLPINNDKTIVVEITVGNHIKQVEAKTSKTANPFFNESVAFEFVETLEIFLLHCLRISIYRTMCHKFIGLCDVELTSVWEQYNHQYYHKWAQLTDPKDIWSGLKGYIKIDIQIIPEGYCPLRHAPENGTELEDNLLIPLRGNLRRQNGLFTINIYNADSIISTKKKYGKQVQVVFQNLYVRVYFARQLAKTKVIYNNVAPQWNQALTFIDAIPSLFQTIRIELWDKKESFLVGGTKLSLKDIGNSTESGFLPSFGPSYIYLYSRDGPKGILNRFGGRMLISIDCKLLDPSSPTKQVALSNISPLDVNLEPKQEIYSLFFAISQCLVFKKSYKRCSFGLNHGARSVKEKNDGNDSIKHINRYIEIDNNIIVDQYNCWFSKRLVPFSYKTMTWPVTIEKEYQINAMHFLLKDVLNNLNELDVLIISRKIHESNEVGKNVLNAMKTFCHKVLEMPSLPYETQLDKAKKENIKIAMKKLIEDIDTAHTNDYSGIEVQAMIRRKIEGIWHDLSLEQPTFAPIEIVLVKDTRFEVSQVFVNPADVLYSTEIEKCGPCCGKFQTVIFRDFSGDDVLALDACIWFGRKLDIYNYFESFKMSVDENVLNSKNIEFHKEFFFEVRVHIFQARLNPGSDSSGLADPFVRVIVFDQIRESQVKAQTLDPFWDETVVFSTVSLYGTKTLIKRQSISIIFEILDYDGPTTIELIGRGNMRPEVTCHGDIYRAPNLKREFIYNYGEVTGEILIACELIEKNLNADNSAVERASKTKLFSIPDDIKPHFQLFKIEAIFWGLRHYHTKILPFCPRLLVCLECNRVKMESNLARAHTNFNFQYQILTGELNLAIEKEYFFPISFSMFQFDCLLHPKFRAGAIVPNASIFKVNPISHVLQVNSHKLHELIQNIDLSPPVELEEHPDWWTKYYASQCQTRNLRVIRIYDHELEKQPEFENFEDFLHLIRLIRGKTDVRTSRSVFEYVGTLKCALAICPYAEAPNDVLYGAVPGNDPLPITIHVYIVAAHNLASTDINGRCDPYIKLSFGKSRIVDRKHYIFKDVNPIFGRVYELKGTFPWDTVLKVSVMDHDCCCCDDLIGTTYIDIENRYYTKHRALCGMSDTYETRGYCKWRDLLYPTEILEQICESNKIPPLQFTDDSVIFGEHTVPTNGVDKENIALSILKGFQDLSDIGYELVPEHTEKRFLYHPRIPDIDQGKLEMWVDIFPGHTAVPTPINITPRKPELYQLRVIVWRLTDVILSDLSLLTGEKSVDVFVKAWLNNPEAAQNTDIHYHSVTGEGIFNYRFIFSFIYSPVDHSIVTYRRGTCGGKFRTNRVPCTLEIQIWDNDYINDDFLGALSLQLWDMPSGTKFAKTCDLKYLQSAPRVSLFKLKKTRGWWPIRASANGKHENKLAGKINLEFELLTEAEALKDPAGLGRDGPHPLPNPRRPSTSLFWAMNPMAFMKMLPFRDFRKTLTYSLIVFALATFLISGWLSLPGILLQRLL